LLYVGIDWAESRHQVCIANDERFIEEFCVPNSQEGLVYVLGKVASLEPQRDKVLFALETQHGPFVGGILDAGYTVYAINPKAVERYRDRFRLAGTKSDNLDARALAGLLRTDREAYRPIKPDSDLARELRFLTRDYANLEKTQTMLTNQLRATLQLYFPVMLELFDDLASPTALGFLKTFPTLEAASKASLRHIAGTLRQYRHPMAEAKAEAIYYALRKPSFNVDPVVARAKSRLALYLVAQLQALHSEMLAYLKEIKALLKKHPDGELFLSLRGAGPYLAARMIGELGDNRDRYPDARVVQATAGTAPVTKCSGKSKTIVFRRACIKPFRETMYQFAFSSIRWCPWAERYYRAKRAAGKHHAEALRALGNVWLKIIFAMWKHKTLYNEKLFLAAHDPHLKSA